MTHTAAFASSSILLDTSAVVAILCREASAKHLLDKLFSASIRLVPATCIAEAGLVLHVKLQRDPEAILNDFVREFEVRVVGFDMQHLAWFHYAFSKFGKGRHPAGLNFGDCFTYAVAKSTGTALLFTGDDFSRTDLVLA
jgi:ribonuclease VapC